MGGNSGNNFDPRNSSLFTGKGTPMGAIGERGSLDVTNPGGIRDAGRTVTALDPTHYMGLGNDGKNWGASDTIQNGAEALGGKLNDFTHTGITNVSKALGGDWEKNNFADPTKSDAAVTQGNAEHQAGIDSQNQADQAQQQQAQTLATNTQNNVNQGFQRDNSLEAALMGAKKSQGQRVFGGF